MTTKALIGTSGDDNYTITDSGYSIKESSNGGTDTVTSNVSYTLDANVENLILVDSSTVKVTNSDGNPVYVYGNPEGWGAHLDYSQGDNTKGYMYDCGVVSAENVLIQLGVLAQKIDYTTDSDLYNEVINYLEKGGDAPDLRSFTAFDSEETSVLKVALSNNLVSISSTNSYLSGRMATDKLVTLLGKFGVSSTLSSIDLDTLAEDVKAGKVAIVEAYSKYLMNGDTSSSNFDHFVTVTGVAYDSGDTLLGFYICDSENWKPSDSSRYLTLEEFKSATNYSESNSLNAVVTASSKIELNTIGTGNNLDNIIIGNSENNILSGAGGNDVIDGGAGNDVINGGAGNDLIITGSGEDVLKMALKTGGNDIVRDAGYDDTLVLTDVSSANGGNVVSFVNGDDLIMVYEDKSSANNSVTFKNFFDEDSAAYIETPANYIGAQNVDLNATYYVSKIQYNNQQSASDCVFKKDAQGIVTCVGISAGGAIVQTINAVIPAYTDTQTDYSITTPYVSDIATFDPSKIVTQQKGYTYEYIKTQDNHIVGIIESKNGQKMTEYQFNTEDGAYTAEYSKTVYTHDSQGNIATQQDYDYASNGGLKNYEKYASLPISGATIESLTTGSTNWSTSVNFSIPEILTNGEKYELAADYTSMTLTGKDGEETNLDIAYTVISDTNSHFNGDLKLSVTIQVPMGQDFIDIPVNEFYYNTDGQITGEQNYTYNQSTGALTDTSAKYYEYNEDGNISKKIEIEYDQDQNRCVRATNTYNFTDAVETKWNVLQATDATWTLNTPLETILDDNITTLIDSYTNYISSTPLNSGSAGADFISGTGAFGGGAGNDTLYGSGYSDTINGDAGNDFVDGGLQNDCLYGDAGNDTLVGGAGNDYEYGGAGNDVFFGEKGNDTLYGEAGNDTIYGDNNIPFSIDGDNFIDGGIGNDELLGGFGDDSIEGGAGNDDVFGAAGDDTLSGGAGNDYIMDPQGNNNIYGGAGNDTIAVSGAGTNHIDGGAGNDYYMLDGTQTSTSIITEGINGGTDTVEIRDAYGNGITAASIANYANVENLDASLIGTGMELTGNAGNNIITGGAGDDLIDGGLGADKMIGGAGEDEYIVDNVKDKIVEKVGEGIDTAFLVGYTGKSYTLEANVENLNAESMAATITLTGNAIDNEITGSDYADKISGGAGNDTLIGGTGNDTLTGGAGADTYFFSEGDKKDLITATETIDIISIDGENDISAYQDMLFYTDKAGNFYIDYTDGAAGTDVIEIAKGKYNGATTIKVGDNTISINAIIDKLGSFKGVEDTVIAGFDIDDKAAQAITLAGTGGNWNRP